MYPIGLEPDGSGNGTTPEGLQRGIDAMFLQPGIMKGCGITLRPTMSYQVGQGAVVAQYSAGRMLIVPIQTTNVTTVAAPSSGSRVDYIYIDLTGAVGVKQSSATVPAGAVVVAEVTVPANITATTSATISARGRIAVPPTVARGPLDEWVEPAAEGATVNVNNIIVKDFVIPPQAVARRLQVTIRQCMYASAGNRGMMRYRLEVGGTSIGDLELLYHDGWQAAIDQHELIIPASGSNTTLRVRRWRSAGATTVYHFGGSRSSMLGGRITVTDIGAAGAV